MLDNSPVSTVRSRNRAEIPERFKWNVQDIYKSWDEWEAAYKTLDAGVERYAALKGTLSVDPENLLRVAPVRRRPARQHDQREAATGPDPLREVEAGRVLVQSRAAADSD